MAKTGRGPKINKQKNPAGREAWERRKAERNKAKGSHAKKSVD